MLGIAITGYKRPAFGLESQIAKLASTGGFSDSLISDINATRQFNFAGRNVEANGYCRWTGANMLQCSGAGEISWSLHPAFDEAQKSTVLRVKKNGMDKRLKIEKQEELPVIFEGQPVTATKIAYRVKGAVGLLTKSEGSNILVAYFVTADVRGRYVSCMLSHWTSDYINDDGLPALPGAIMKLK